jgi:transcriptional regulator with XRE-family HTH domain
LAKPDWQTKRRDGDRGHSRARDYREPMRDHVVLQLASSRRPSGPRPDNSKPQVVKQGVNGALRAANLRLLLEHAPVREALALVAEVPLERLEAMSQGALCPDETAFHIERTLKLPGKWLDGLNQEVPERTLELLKHPDKAGLHDDDFDEDVSAAPSEEASAPAQSAAVLSAVTPPASGPVQATARDASVRHSQVAEVVAAAPGESAQEEALLAADSAKPIATVEEPQAPGMPAAQASTVAAAAAAGKPRSSAESTRPESGPKDTYPMSSPELRQQNLSMLLQGKGAKSALARLIGISQPYMSTIANGGKVLDQEFCRNVARTLGMPEDWFEAPRTAADIPAAALRLLAPLPRGAAASAHSAPTSDTAEAAAAGTSGPTTPEVASAPAESSESATAVTGAAASDTTTTSASHEGATLKDKAPRVRPVSQRDDRQRNKPSRPATAPVQADLLTHVELDAQPSVQETTPVVRTEVMPSPALVVDVAPMMAPVSDIAHQAVQRTSDFMPMSAQPLVIEGGLAPITEALIKILVLKARQGALSEDKAFELLGEARLL